MGDLAIKKCVPCEGGVLPLGKEQIKEYLAQLQREWEVEWKDDEQSQAKTNGLGARIKRTFRFNNFQEAIGFVNKAAELAEREGHHPDIRVFGWNKVEIELSTHAIGGLSENDFILAAKIEQLQ
jgi:4a-hydroxytetrahydrobiopterin dehydratase